MLAHTARCLRAASPPPLPPPEPAAAAAANSSDADLLAERGDGVPLTAAQVAQFVDEGVIALPGIIPPELNQALLIASWRDCHFADIPSPSLLKHLLKGEGGAAE